VLTCSCAATAGERAARCPQAPRQASVPLAGGRARQLLLDAGYRSAGVSIDGAAVKGLLATPLSQIKATFPSCTTRRTCIAPSRSPPGSSTTRSRTPSRQRRHRRCTTGTHCRPHPSPGGAARITRRTPGTPTRSRRTGSSPDAITTCAVRRAAPVSSTADPFDSGRGRPSADYGLSP
jgi:hypothetical protein